MGDTMLKLIETVGGYAFWHVATDNGKPVYTVTTGAPPKGTGGYYDLDYLKRVKGVR